VKLQRFEVPGLAHYSYLLGSGAKAVVIDPKRDCDTYFLSTVPEFTMREAIRITLALVMSAQP
jgi:hypothetical protein